MIIRKLVLNQFQNGLTKEEIHLRISLSATRKEDWMSFKRSRLQTGIQLCRADDLYKQPVYFRIDSRPNKVGEGSEVLSYVASHEGSGKGILKEYYPVDAYYLKRNEQGQLVCLSEEPEYKEKIKESVDAYLAGIQQLQKFKREREDRDLENFIPEFEIYRGILEDGTYADSYYIWSPSSSVTVFSEFCQTYANELHSNQGPYLLAKGIDIIRTLSRDIKTLHEIGLIHRDIKPQNFGFSSHEGCILEDTVTLFDVNSIIQVGAKCSHLGTPGYIEPEFILKPADNQTDIYSIGSVLYHLLFCGHPSYSGYGFDLKELKKMISKGEDLVIKRHVLNADQLTRLLYSMPVLNQMAIEVSRQLAEILKKCLAPRSFRYASCEDLLKDLDILNFLLLKYQTTEQVFQYKKWKLVDQNEILKEQSLQTELALIQHLWSHPFYKSALGKEWSGKKELRVVIIGFGLAAQKYLDLVLQAGQIPDWFVRAQIVVDNQEAIEDWKKKRPALEKFITFQNTVPPVKKSYASVEWKVLDSQLFQDSDILLDAIQRDVRPFEANAVLLDLGSDSLNEQIADFLKQTAVKWGNDLDVSWIRLAKTNTPDAVDSRCSSLPISLVSLEQGNNKDNMFLDQLGLNIHLLYKDSLSQNYEELYNEYLDKNNQGYNYISSLRAAFSIKYKLFSMGIDLDSLSMEQVLKALQDKKGAGSDSNRLAQRDRMVCCEHRRWVIEKACDGMTCLSDLNSLIPNQTRNKEKNSHICLVDCQEISRLSEIPRTPAAWNSLNKTEIASMDELDQLSVRLHQMYQYQAQNLRGMIFSEKPVLQQLEYFASQSPSSLTAFLEWLHCIQEIEKGYTNYAKYYEPMKNAFIKSTNSLPNSVHTFIASQVEAFNQLFYPVIGSVKCRDFRESDAVIVDHLDFILSYKNLYLGIPWKRQDDSYEKSFINRNDLFDKMAAMMIWAPSTVAYFIDLPTEWYSQNKESWQEDMEILTRFMNHKNLRTKVELVLFAEEEVGSDAQKRCEKVMGTRLNSVVIYPYHSGDPVHSLRIWLQNQAKQERYYILEENDAMICGILANGGLYQEYSSYRLDSRKQKLIRQSGSESAVLSTIPMLPSLSIGDLLCFHGANTKEHHQPEYANEIEKLREYYFRDPKSWKILCHKINENLEKFPGRQLAFFFPNDKANTSDIPQLYEYLAPQECRESLQLILNEMIHYNLIDSKSQILPYSSEELTLRVLSHQNLEVFFSNLLKKPYRLFSSRYIHTDYNRSTHTFSVYHYNLSIKEIPISCSEKELLNFWQDIHYIRDLKFQNSEDEQETASFIIATKKARELLSNAERMLEVHVYDQMIRTGKFDDIVSGFEVVWNEQEGYDEFDIVAVKGFQTVVVECKSSPVTQDDLLKFQNLSHRLGIRVIPVLVAQSEEKAGSDLEVINEGRGSNSKEITIFWKQDDLRNIGSRIAVLLD